MTYKKARKMTHRPTDGDIEQMRQEAGTLNHPTSWFCRKYNIVPSTFYKYTQDIKKPGSRYKKHRPEEGRARLVKPGSLTPKTAAKLKEDIADATAQLRWTVTRTTPELRTVNDNAKVFMALGNALGDPSTGLGELEQLASACGFLVDVRFRSV